MSTRPAIIVICICNSNRILRISTPPPRQTMEILGIPYKETTIYKYSTDAQEGIDTSI